MSGQDATAARAAGLLGRIVERSRAGDGTGITSVCSAHPVVLAAAAREAASTGAVLLVEATSNQVDQDGGYTGMRPPEFRDLVHRVAREQGLPLDRIVLGGDHLGPNVWRSQPEPVAMARAEELVRAYVAAGFVKIHLDCSMPLAGDPRPLPDATVAQRAARLLAVAERTAAESGLEGLVRYVIGTEVPVPGGAHETIDRLEPTDAAAARATVQAHRAAFAAVGAEDAWPRVMALVVQPGVEFDHVRVVDFDPPAADGLVAAIDDQPSMVFEAHSTDYQTAEALSALVERRWAVLKVGPGLTFALREGLLALSAIERELVPPEDRADFPDVLDRAMLADPGRWAPYYEGDEREQRLARRYSYSDRARYYLPEPGVERAVDRLLEGLRAVGVPDPLLSQHLPDQYRRVRSGVLDRDPLDLLIDRVRDVLRPYSAATA